MSSIKCSHCGLVNWDAVEVCRRCAAPVAPGGEWSISTQGDLESGAPALFEVNDGLRPCPACHIAYDQSARLCPHCGHRLVESSASKGIIAIALLLFGILFAIWSLLR